MRCLSFVEWFFNCITPLKAQKGLLTPSGYITIEIPETGDCLPLHQHFAAAEDLNFFFLSQPSRTSMPYVCHHIGPPASSDSYRRDATVSHTKISYFRQI